MAQSNTTFFPVPIDNSKVPAEGPVAVALQYDFSGGVQAYDTDMQLIRQQKKISLVQSVYIDNAANTQPVQLRVVDTGQQINVPASFQGVFPVFVSGRPVFRITSTGNGQANIYFCNVQQAAFMWQAVAIPISIGGTLPVSDAILDATVSNNRVNTTAFEAPATVTDKSGTVAVGGVSQTLMAANANRRGWCIQNMDEAILEGIYYRQGGAVVPGNPGSFCVAAASGPGYPGGYAQGVGVGAIFITAPTTGHKFSAWEW